MLVALFGLRSSALSSWEEAVGTAEEKAVESDGNEVSRTDLAQCRVKVESCLREHVH